MDGSKVTPPSEITTKGELDRLVALRLGKPVREVSAITREFLHAAGQELVELRQVRLTNLGTLKVVARRGRVNQLVSWIYKKPVIAISQKKYHVSFRKAPELTKAIRRRHVEGHKENIMEKYGVDESQAENEKKASQGCPECGAKAERHGNVLACPKHGTEPFEAKTK